MLCVYVSEKEKKAEIHDYGRLLEGRKERCKEARVVYLISKAFYCSFFPFWLTLRVSLRAFALILCGLDMGWWNGRIRRMVGGRAAGRKELVNEWKQVWWWRSFEGEDEGGSR